MLVAAVLARAGLRDSAEITIRRSLVDAAGDPEILPLEASARIFLGQPDVAVARLAQYVRGRPLHRTAVACSRRFAALRSLRSLRRQGGVYAGGIASRAGYAVDLAVDDDADVLVASEIGRAPNAVDRADQGEDDREPNEDRRLPNSEERFHVMPPVEVNGPPKIGSDVQTRIGNFCQ